MTGIEKLRALAYKKNFLEPAEARELDAIADQIEREQDAMVADSPYDALPPEDREAIAWVREHGGLDAVERRWECLSYYADPVPRSCMEKRLARLQRQIDESHEALRRRNQRIEELGHRFRDLASENVELRKRAMPEGVEWPRYEDGEPVRIGDVVSDVEVRSVVFRDGGILLSDCTSVPGWGTWRSYKEPIKRPAVLAADGEPLEVGQTVYATHYGYVKCTVLAIEWDVDDYLVEVENEGGHKFRQTPDEFTHQRPVLDADGVPIKVGDTVWMVDDPDGPYRVTEVTTKYATHVHGYSDEFGDLDMSPSQLTHERPDSLDRLAEDIGAMVAAWRSKRGLFDAQEAAAGCVGENTLGAALDSLVRRVKALAGDA